MLSPTMPSFAGSKRCAAGNIINTLNSHQVSSDSDHQPRHINPKLLCCAAGTDCHSAIPHFHAQSSSLQPSKYPAMHPDPVDNWTKPLNDDESGAISEARFRALCSACVIDDDCPNSCAIPCPGDDKCPGDAVACCEAQCDIECPSTPCPPCFKEECPDPCTKISCPGAQCVCPDCEADPCPLQHNWDPCHVNHHTSSLPTVVPCPSDTACHAPFVFGANQTNSHGQSARVESSFDSQPSFHGNSSHQSRPIENMDIFSSDTNTNEFRYSFHTNGQLIQHHSFSDAHNCLIDVSFEHCYYGPHSCCHIGAGTCEQCQEASQSSHSISRGSNYQQIGCWGKHSSSTNHHCQSFAQRNMHGFEYSHNHTSSSMSSEPTEPSASSLNPLSSSWLSGSQSWDNSMPQFLNSDLRSSLIHCGNVNMMPGKYQGNSAALSYPSPISKPGTSSGKTTMCASPIGDDPASGRVSSISVGLSSEDDSGDHTRAPSLRQDFGPTSKEHEAYICRWKPSSSAICLDQFQSAEALHNHIKACHIGKMNGSCFCQWEGCDEDHTKDFKQRSKLARHLLVHAGYRPYKCGHDGCEKTFATNQAKDNHERTHAGDKPYQCKHCSYVTTTATQLKTHINAKHIKDKCFHCRICAFCCADSSNLSKHEKTHRSRPYRCLHPGCTFKNDCRWENVKRHFKKSGHCPELLVDDSPAQVRYKQEAAELAKRDPLPKKVSRVRRTGEVMGREEGESSC